MDMTLNRKVEAYFSRQPGWGPVKVLDAQCMAGGISRETWKFSLDRGAAGRRDIVVRLDPPVSLLASHRTVEYELFRAFDGVPGVPVPKMLCNEDDPAHLGASFMAGEVLPGIADISAIALPAFAATGPQIARAHFQVLGAISRLNPADKQLDRLLPSPSCESAAADALAHWKGVLRGMDLGPGPITAAAIRHLERQRPPPAAKVCVVHGDYRLGNCLYLPDGRISGVLDWEMAHLGDPLEDLAWALHPDWRPSAAPPDRVAGHLTEPEAIAEWEASSGLAADAAGLRWWRLFSCVKAAVIFMTGADNFIKARGGHPAHALNAWFFVDNQEARMLDAMGVTA
jgi:aminoglycoside phosphotransferase (APT) family kinase protein